MSRFTGCSVADVRGASLGGVQAGRRWLASLLALGLSAILVYAPARAAGAQLISYTTVPGAVASSNYTVKVNGTPVFVEKFGDVSMVRFAFVGQADVEVTANAAMTGAILSPQSYQLAPTIADRTMRFALMQPRKLILQVAGVEKLLLFADGPERQPRRAGQAGVINLAAYLSSSRNPATPVTAEVQRAIDDTSAANSGAGGVLYVPDGLYMTTQLRLKSNVELYLDSGALIRAVPIFNATNYPTQNGADSSFIYISQANNVRIAGRGIIDGNGYQLRMNTPGGGNNKLLRTRAATGVILEDVYFRDSARWSLHFLYSDDIYARNVKLINDLRVLSGATLPFVTNTDGFDIDASTFVTVEDSFVYTTDDAFTPKVTGYMGVKKQAHDIFIRNNVIWTQKCALKVGDEVLDDIYGVHFDNNDTVLADRFIALWNISSKTIRNVTASFNRTETIGVRDNKSFFYYYIRTNPGFVRDIEVNGLQALTRAPNESRMEGYDDTHRVSNFVAKNLYVAGTAMNTAANIPLVMRNAYVSNISVLPPGADGLPLVQVSASDDYAVEGVDRGVFTFSRAGSLDAALTVRFSVSGTASAGVDYASLGGSVTIPAGAQQVSLPLTALADGLNEAEESVVLNLAADAAYRPDVVSSARMAIGNGETTPVVPTVLPIVSVVVEDGSASESQSPVNSGRFRVARSGSLSAALTVNVSFSGTATNGTDYAALASQVTIPAGADRVKVLVLPKWDGVAESHEKVVMSVVPTAAYQTGTATGSLTILNVKP